MSTLRTMSDFLERLKWARSVGLTFDGKRDVWGKLGYPETITQAQYRARYERGGIAGRIVDALPKAVWRGDGDLFEDEDPEEHTQFETEWQALKSQLNVWEIFQRTHILASLGSFAGLLLGAPGPFNTELPKGKPGQLLYLTPYGGDVINTTANRTQVGTAGMLGADLSIATYEEDTSSPRFGQPKTYQLKRTNIASSVLPREVHWTRIVHIPAPGFLDDAIFGRPVLEKGFNYLLDLDKVAGGGAEAFWLRANAGLQIDIDKKVPATEAAASLEHLEEQAEDYEHQLSRIMRTRGVNMNQLGSDVADFSQPVDALVTLIAGAYSIPKRILTGSEMGTLASEQDRDNWNDTVKDCRSSYAFPIVICPTINRLIDYGYLSKPKQWDAMWPDAESMGEGAKLDAAAKMIGLNDHGEKVIEGNEVREFLGYEPLDPLQQETQQEEQIAKLEAALRKGGTLSLAVKP